MNNRFEKQTGTILALWALLVLYAGARVLQIFPGRVPIVVVVALHVLPPTNSAPQAGSHRWAQNFHCSFRNAGK